MRRRRPSRWRDILQTLVCYRLIDPGSEWRVMTYAFARVGAWSAPGPHGDGPVLEILAACRTRGVSDR